MSPGALPRVEVDQGTFLSVFVFLCCFVLVLCSSSSSTPSGKCIEDELGPAGHSGLLDEGSSSYLLRELAALGPSELNLHSGGCMNGGVCKNGTCICKDGWQGNFCQFCGGKVR